MITRTTYLNGVKLPVEFTGATIIDNLAFPSHGSICAFVDRKGKMHLGDATKPIVLGRTFYHFRPLENTLALHAGKGTETEISLDAHPGDVLAYALDSPSTQRRDGSQRFGVDKGYDNTQKISARSTTPCDLELMLHDAERVSLNGEAAAVWLNTHEAEGQAIHLKEFTGRMALPRYPLVVLDILLAAGEVHGAVAQVGRIKAQQGNMRLDVAPHVRIDAQPYSGTLTLHQDAKCLHPPTTMRPLRLRTGRGNITVVRG